jgi:integrase
MGANSTTKAGQRKTADRPAKPYDGFPLYAHASGHWAKKIRGRIHYFGRWGRRVNSRIERIDDDGWRPAETLYNEQKADLHAGRTPRLKSDELTIAELANRFLTAKLRRMQAAELSPRTFREYREATDLLVATFGKERLVEDLRPEDFEALRAEMAKRWGPARLGKFVQLIRSTFIYADRNGLVERPVKFGSEFVKPSNDVLKRHRNSAPKKLFTNAEIRLMLEALEGKQVTIERNGSQAQEKLAPNLQLRAAVLLGINAGAGNTDIANLQFWHLDLEAGWLDYPRPKTGAFRRVPLWSQTIDALRRSIAERRQAKLIEDAQCVFLNRAGRRLVQATDSSSSDYVSAQFRALLRALAINGRKGLGFYSLRHTFSTHALQAQDRDAVKYIMGHVETDMTATYDHAAPDDERLRAVVDYVKNWLFGAKRARVRRAK